MEETEYSHYCGVQPSKVIGLVVIWWGERNKRVGIQGAEKPKVAGDPLLSLRVMIRRLTTNGEQDLRYRVEDKDKHKNNEQIH